MGKALLAIGLALQEISADLPLVFPVHPRTRSQLPPSLLDSSRIQIIEPLGYLDFLGLMAKAKVVLTDSGGIQEEAPSLGKPVVVTRETTERPEAVDAGLAKLVGMNRQAILTEAQNFLDTPEDFAEKVQEGNPYGDGNAADRIVDILVKSLAGEQYI